MNKSSVSRNFAGFGELGKGLPFFHFFRSSFLSFVVLAAFKTAFVLSQNVTVQVDGLAVLLEDRPLMRPKMAVGCLV